eukprot:3572222-Pleurochrysis_carterae.AAC.1
MCVLLAHEDGCFKVRVDSDGNERTLTCGHFQAVESAKSAGEKPAGNGASACESRDGGEGKGAGVGEDIAGGTNAGDGSTAGDVEKSDNTPE